MTSSEVADSGQQKSINLGTSLVFVAAIAGMCGVIAGIKRCYGALPSNATPLYPEEYVSLAVVLWIILGSLAVFAIRKSSITQLVGLVALSSAIVTARLTVPNGSFDASYGVLWPAACFGVCFVLPHFLIRFNRAGNRVLILADAAFVALLTYVFAVRGCVRLM